MHRIAVISLGLACVATNARAQARLREYRPEVIVTVPNVAGVDVKFLVDERLDMSTHATNEIIVGAGLQSPQFHRASAAVEVRYVKALNGAVEHRYVPTLYTNFALPGGFDLRNRDRLDLRAANGGWSRRYINRSAIGHDVSVLDRAIFPYVQSDLYYDTRVGYLNRRDWTVGVRAPLTSGSSIDPFVARSSDTSRLPHLGFTAGAVLRVTL
ncbi:MAG: hypothetical protein ABI969_19690 [bacterium]